MEPHESGGTLESPRSRSGRWSMKPIGRIPETFQWTSGRHTARSSEIPSDFLFLGVTRSSSVLRRIGTFIEASGTGADALGVEIDTEELLQPCDHLDLSWLGYEPYARGEWGLLSLLESSPALAHWLNHVNNYGLVESPQSCLAFATDYRTTMGKPGGPNQ